MPARVPHNAANDKCAVAWRLLWLRICVALAVAEDPLCFALTLAVALKATSAEWSHRGLGGGESSRVSVLGEACGQQGEERHIVSWSAPRRGGVWKLGEEPYYRRFMPSHPRARNAKFATQG